MNGYCCLSVVTPGIDYKEQAIERGFLCGQSAGCPLLFITLNSLSPNTSNNSITLTDGEMVLLLGWHRLLVLAGARSSWALLQIRIERSLRTSIRHGPDCDNG